MPFIDRPADKTAISKLIRLFPITAILGPRQVGKTTLAKTFSPDHIFDLENPRDMVQLDNPQLALESLEGLIMIDEIQRKPELFPLLRYLVDHRPEQKYLILGSASSNLRQQSGESLAGRIGYHYLTGLNLAEIEEGNMDRLWLRGGFPRSYLTDNDEQSLTWRNNFIATFLEKDLRLLGINIPASTMYRFWIMLSHYHGQTINYSELGRSFGIRDKTVKYYLSILEDTFMLRQLLPWHTNISKRLVKSPKIYLRDSGIFHALQSIEDHKALRTHPKLGTSWEGFALEEVVSTLGKRDNEVFFYGTHGGLELDLFWKKGNRGYGVEFKFMDAPRTTKSMYQAIKDLDLDKLYVVYPGNRSYLLSDKIMVVPLTEIGKILK
jgi:predicted AAA+ superfamily ATPase